MSDDLVKELREAQALYERAGVDGCEGARMMKKAADHIEALQAENERLRYMIRKIKRDADEWCISRMTGNPQIENDTGEAMWQTIRRVSTMTSPIEAAAIREGDDT